MAHIVLVYAPFCTPASPPYSLTNIYSFLKANGVSDVVVEDLNVRFHAKRYPAFYQYVKSLPLGYEKKEYERLAKEFLEDTKATYTQNNTRVLEGGVPEQFEEMLAAIMIHAPAVVAFSVIYSSQAFYVSALMDALQKKGITVIVGGPALNHHLREKADKVLRNEIELLEYLRAEMIAHEDLVFGHPLEFEALPLEEYFVPSLVLPLRTTSSCYYQQCAFCTHHGNIPYYEYPIGPIVETIKRSGKTHVFFTDDMIHKKRLLELAAHLAPLGVHWMCQLRPMAELDRATLQTLYDAGLRHVVWGVESGSERILTLMKKGTNPHDAALVLHDAAAVGIKNALYIMFGFPTETKEEFLMTIEFLKENASVVDIVSTSVFGLQKDAPAFKTPEEYGIASVHLQERALLDAKVSYSVLSGMDNAQAKLLRKKHKGTFGLLDKYPKQMNLFREHLLCLCD